MKPSPLPCLMILAALLPAAAEAAVQDSRWSAQRSGEVLVQYRENGASAEAKTLHSRYGLKVVRELRGGRVQLLQLPAITDVADALALLRADPAIALAEPNYLRRKLEAIPDDPLFFEQWGLRSTGQLNFASDDPALASMPGADMDLGRAWDRDGDGMADRVGDGSVIVAVIDDAFDVDHPDLAANFIAGRDTARNDNDPRPESTLQSHGTWVSGALGAIGNNGLGIAGIAWNLRILPIKVGRIADGVDTLDSAAILAAYDFARAQGASIVNASYGGPGFSEIERQAIAELATADILFVTSAGNEDSNTDDAVLSYPANYDLPNIVAVAASNRQDDIASFSQYGPRSVDLAAPGLQIVTTAPDAAYTYDAADRSASGIAGTSFSSPYVAGIAALIRMEYPSADFREVKARLIEGAEASGTGGATQLRTSAGRANAANSLELTPRPALVIQSVRLIDDGNQRLDPGETLDIEVTLENLWQAATNVQARLRAPAGTVTVIDDTDAIPAIPSGGTGVARYTVQVPADAAGYRHLFFTVELSAAGGYAAQRSFSQEIAELRDGTTVNQRLSTGLYDEFHAYHFDLAALPAGRNRLTFRSSSGSDIDLLIKRGRPPRYLITLAVNPDGEQVFETDADQIGGEASGNEEVAFDCPEPGSYYVTVVNYDQVENNDYTLLAETSGASTCDGSAGDDGFFGNGSGGSIPGGSLLLLSLAALWGRRRR